MCGVGCAANAGVGGRRTGELHRLLVASDRLRNPTETLGGARLRGQRHHVSRQQRDRLAVAKERVVQLPEARLPDLAGAEVRPADQAQLVPTERDVAEPIEGPERPEGFAGAGAELAQELERGGKVGRQLERGLAMEPGPGDVVLAQRRQSRELHVRLGGLERIPRQRRQAAVRPEGPGPVLGLVRGARQRPEGWQVVRPDAENRVQRPHCHLRRVSLGGAGCGLGGGEGGGLVSPLPGQLHQREPPFCAPGGLAAALSHDGLCPERRGAVRAATGQRLDDVERVLVRGGVGDEEGEQPLQRERVRLVGAGAAQVGLPGLGELAGGHQRLGVGEGPGALEREQQLLVEQRRRRQRSGGEAEPESERRDFHSGQAGPVERRHAEAARDGGEGDQLRQHPGGEAVRAPELDVGQRCGALGRP